MKNQLNQIPVKWTNKHIYVDIDTGEQITKYNAKQNYTVLHTVRHSKYDNYAKTKGTTEHTHKCRHRQQQELPFTD